MFSFALSAIGIKAVLISIPVVARRRRLRQQKLMPAQCSPKPSHRGKGFLGRRFFLVSGGNGPSS
jgi:hypothetical protein